MKDPKDCNHRRAEWVARDSRDASKGYEKYCHGCGTVVATDG